MQNLLSRGSGPAVAMVLPLTAVLVALGYFPGGIAPGHTLRWALLSVLVPLALLLASWGPAPGRVLPGQWLAGMLLAYAILSVSWASSVTEALNGAWLLTLFTGCILLGSLASLPVLGRTYRVFALALLPSVFVAVLQALHLPTGFVEQAREYPSGLFMSSQLFGEIGALGFVLAPVGSLTQLLVLLGVVLSGSRAALLAVALAGAVLYVQAIRGQRGHRLPVGVLAGVLGLATGLYLAFAKTAGILASADAELGSGLSRASALRWPLWSDTLQALSLAGHGIGTYFVDMPRYVQAYPVAYIGRPEFAENEFLTFAFELGVPGAVLLAGLFGLALARRHDLQPRLAGLALLVVSCLGFPLHMPATLFLGGLVLGHCLRDPEPPGPRDRDAGPPGAGAPAP